MEIETIIAFMEKAAENNLDANGNIDRRLLFRRTSEYFYGNSYQINEQNAEIMQAYNEVLTNFNRSRENDKIS